MGESILKDIYYDPEHPGSFGGINNLFFHARKQDASLKRKDVETWLRKQETWSMFQNINRKFPRLQIIVERINEQWQCDLLSMEWFKEENNGVKYLLTIIDVMSRFAYVYPLKDKSAESIVNCFNQQFEKVIPEKIQTDQGKEFVNKKLLQLFEKKNVKFFTSTDDVIKCAIVERFNQTLRSRIYRFIHSNQSYHYISSLQKIVNAYNSSYHSTIKMAPKDVNENNLPEVIRNIKSKNKSIKKIADRFSVGDYVRISRKKGYFEKGAVSNFGEEVFRIWKKKRTETTPFYKIEDLDGEKISSIFYPFELIKWKKPEKFKVESILATRMNKRTGKKEYLIKWLGYPKKFNSWTVL